MSFTWPNGHRLAFCLVVNIEDAQADSPSGASIADLQYGLRSGFVRITDLLSEYSVKATFVLDADLLAREEVFAEFIESRAHEALLHASSMGSGPTLTRRYLLEPAADDEPYEREGLLRLPLMQDCSDRRFLDAPALTPDAWLQYAIDTFDVLYAESEYATRVYALPVHAHIIGRPGRINALEQILQYASSREHVWVATARDIAEHILAQPDQNLQEAHA